MTTTESRPRKIQTLGHLKSKKKPNTKSCRISLDSEIAEEFEARQKEYEEAKRRLGYTTGTAQAEAQIAYEAARLAYQEYKPIYLENSVKFVFRAIGRKPYDDLLSKHPATPEQLRESPDAVFDAETFTTALIAASMIEPVVAPPEAELQELFDSNDWSQSEIITLFMTALQANTSHLIIQMGKD